MTAPASAPDLPAAVRAALDVTEARYLHTQCEYLRVFHVTTSAGEQLAVRCMPDRMLAEGHYGISYTDVRDAQRELVARLLAADATMPAGVVRWSRVFITADDEWFCAARPWLPLLADEADGLSPTDLHHRLAPVADALDELADRREMVGSLHTSNVVVVDGQARLADAGVAWMKDLILRTYSGPYKGSPMDGKEMAAFAHGLHVVGVAAGRFQRELCALWVRLRTGHDALPPPDLLQIPGSLRKWFSPDATGWERLSPREQAAIRPLLAYREPAPDYPPCVEVLQTLASAAAGTD